MKKHFHVLTDDELLSVAGRLIAESEMNDLADEHVQVDIDERTRTEMLAKFAANKNRLENASYRPVVAPGLEFPLISAPCSVRYHLDSTGRNFVEGKIERLDQEIKVELASKIAHADALTDEFVPSGIATANDETDPAGDTMPLIDIGARYRLTVEDDRIDLAKVLSIQIREVPALANKPGLVLEANSTGGCPIILIDADFVRVDLLSCDDAKSLEFALAETICAVNEYVLVLVMAEHAG